MVSWSAISSFILKSHKSLVTAVTVCFQIVPKKEVFIEIRCITVNSTQTSLYPPAPLLSNTPNPSTVTPLPFLLAPSGGPSPIFSFSAIILSNSASLLAISTCLTLSFLALACNSPNGSNRSLSGSLNGFLTQLPLSVRVVERGRLLSTS